MAKANKVASSAAYESIKNDIIQGVLSGGTPLVEEVLAERYCVSRTPIREALKRLENDGIVVSFPYRGYYIKELTETDVVEIYTVRQALEGICCNRAASEITDENIALLEDNLAQAVDALLNGDVENASLLGDYMHDMILSVGGNLRIRQILERMKVQTLQLGSISTRVSGRVEKSLLEHEGIIKALKEHDGELAEKRMRDHLTSTQQDVLKTMRNTNNKLHA